MNDSMKMGDAVSVQLGCGHPGVKETDTSCPLCGAAVNTEKKAETENNPAGEISTQQ